MCLPVFVQFLHKLTARALIRDHEDGSLDGDEAQHEVRVLCIDSKSRRQDKTMISGSTNVDDFILNQ